MRFCPAPLGTGLQFKRVDLPGQPLLPASITHVIDTSRSTTIGRGELRIHTVEHVLAALYAYEIDNLWIELDSLEPPIGNGSSDVFVTMIEEAGIETQAAEVTVRTLYQPLYWSEGDIQIVALPDPTFRVSYTLSYPHVKPLAAQFHTLAITPESFKKELAPCRTFALYEEIEVLKAKGLIQGGSLDNAVMVKGDECIAKNGLFFSNEQARHKMLDMVGDFALLGFPFKAHLIAIRGGHTSNWRLGQKLLEACV